MPPEGTEQRKLAAIMFTDMVGYSGLAQRDDKLALELLEEHRQLLREIFPRFNGTEIKTIGDAFLIEFHSALEAAQCAIEIQRTLAKRNHDVTAERRIELKIGIHIGDVVHRGDDVYGDGVNIASRIEQLAAAGGICVSTDVERQIRNALETRFEKLAPTELKNISLPMDLIRIVLPWEQKSDVRALKFKASTKSMPEIGQELRADAIVDGSVIRDGNQVTVNVQLIEARTDRHLWAKKFERDVTNIFKMRNEVVEAIAHEIQATISPEQSSRLSSARAVNPTALQEYLLGRQSWLRQTENGFTDALDHFNRAKEI